MPIRKIKQINLIPQDEFETSSFGRILKWALSTFRTMVIFTELVVMSAFLSRFWLDAKNSDLNESINISKSQIMAYENVEMEFRLLQKRINVAKSLYSEPKTSSLITEISKRLPGDVVLISLSKIDNQLTIKASSFSEQSIAQFVVNLEESGKIENVNLSQVFSNLDNNVATLFSISADVKNNTEKGGTI